MRAIRHELFADGGREKVRCAFSAMCKLDAADCHSGGGCTTMQRLILAEGGAQRPKHLRPPPELSGSPYRKHKHKGQEF